MAAITSVMSPMASAGQAPSAVETEGARPSATAARIAWQRAVRRSIPAVKLMAVIDAGVITTALFATGVADASVPSSLPALLTWRISVVHLALTLAIAAGVVVVFEVAGLYEAMLVRRWKDEVHLAMGATAAIALVAALAAGLSGRTSEAAMVWRFWLLGFSSIAVVRTVRSYVTRSVVGRRRVVIVGSGPHALRICRELSIDPLTSYHVIGFIDTHGERRSPFIKRRTIGAFDALESILVREHVDEVHIGLPVKSLYREIQDTIRVCERIGVKAMYGADLFGTELARPGMAAAGASPRIELQVVAQGARVYLKRVFDVAGAATLLIALAPLMLTVALAIKLTSQGPVIFSQERYGLNRRRFRMLKFRTMVPNAEQLMAALESQNELSGPAFKMARDPRVTPIGRLLRRTSIDELPQLVNVLRGDMSLVGPRPMSVRDVHLFTRTADMRRFSVTPGLTGLWQVSGRTRLAFDDWIRLDLHYIDNWSLLLDFRILSRTLPAVIRGTGAA